MIQQSVLAQHEGHSQHQQHQPQTNKQTVSSPKVPAKNQANTHDQHNQQHSNNTEQPASHVNQSTTDPKSEDPHAGHQIKNVNISETELEQRRLNALPAMRLLDLEQLARENNPTLKQAAAAVEAAEGRRRQARLWPNPTIGYFGEEISLKAPSFTSEHGIFIQQTIPLGGKLSKSSRIFEFERVQAESMVTAQQQRVINSVRMLYFQALGAQRMVELRAELARLTREAVDVSEELYNVGQADKPDLMEIEIEAQRAELALYDAENERARVWQALGAVVGKPGLQPARLIGNLEEISTWVDYESSLATLLAESPELKAARAAVERARAVLTRAKAERVPDMTINGGYAYNLERLDDGSGRRIGNEVRIQIGFRLPIFDRNQGAIAAAQADLTIATQEVQRLELSLRMRLADALRNYRNLARMEERYRTIIIPRALAAYEMYRENYKQMAAAYPQVMIAQRNYYQVQAEYTRALTNLQQQLISVRGLLLTGGLDSPGQIGSSSTDTSTTRVNSLFGPQSD